jgi:hypothetical protein
MWTLVIIVMMVGLAVIGYIGIRLGPWLLGLYDRALRNSRERVEPSYELPVYAKRDLAAKWPGWDGWYALMIPSEKSVPSKAIRASIMTGLYGLDRIDTYAKLGGLSAFHAVEYLTMVQTNDASHLFQQYLPKSTDLAIRREQLLVSVKDWGQISGQWPYYQVEMTDAAGTIEFSLAYTAKHLLWWADLPKLFTYFAAFADVHGTIAIDGQEYTISGQGTFEHGFARKPFNFDALLTPFRMLQRLFHFTLIHYHYNILIGEDGSHGGMMLAQGMGIAFRNLGGIYLPDGRFLHLSDIKVVYVELEELRCRSAAPPVLFPKTWRVQAQADGGLFEYTATRESPLARIARKMIYFDFGFTGTYREPGKAALPLSGHGYGEYVRI